LNKFFIIKDKFLSIEKTVKNVLMQILTESVWPFHMYKTVIYVLNLFW
jgi:hypothetical protein